MPEATKWYGRQPGHMIKTDCNWAPNLLGSVFQHPKPAQWVYTNSTCNNLLIRNLNIGWYSKHAHLQIGRPQAQGLLHGSIQMISRIIIQISH